MTYIILTNYNSFQDSKECIQSLLALEHRDFRIVLVDNSDTDEYLTILFSDFQNISQLFYEDKDYIQKDSLITFIKAKQNNGFAAANNVGLQYVYKHTDYDFVWLLNNDTVVKIDTLNYMVNTMKNDPNIAICGAKIVSYYNRDVIQVVAGNYNKFFGKTNLQGEGKPVKTSFAKLQIDFVPGCSMFFSKDFLEKVPYLCEDYFLYFEELDLAERVKQNNMKLAVCQDAIVYHKGGSTICEGRQSKSKLSIYYLSKSVLLYTWKFHKLCLIPVTFSFFLVIFNRIIKKESHLIKSILKGMVDGYKWILFGR